jgi:predicted RNA binding protein YcfA (HicA-like mRNA interferase family)
MAKIPVDAPKAKVIKALGMLGFRLVRDERHLALLRENADGSRTPMTIPNHPRIKGSTLRRACTQAGISRDDFLKALCSNVSVSKIPRLLTLFCVPWLILVPLLMV